MDQSITERPQTEAEKLLAHHPSTKALTIYMTETPFSSQVAAKGEDAKKLTQLRELLKGIG
jgi:hypothetical protein